MTITVSHAGVFTTRTRHIGLVLPKYVPLLFISFSGLFFGVWIKYLSKFFSNAEAHVESLHALN